jgi:V8-like Glu-specific endopeptidase
MATMPGRDLNTLWVDGYPADKSPIYSLWEATGPASSCGGSDNKQYWGFVMDESAGQSGGGRIAPCRIYGFGEC